MTRVAGMMGLAGHDGVTRRFVQKSFAKPIGNRGKPFVEDLHNATIWTAKLGFFFQNPLSELSPKESGIGKLTEN